MNAAPPPPPPVDQSMPSESQEQRIKLKMAYYQSKICYGLSLVFVVSGFFVFAGVYEKRIAPDFMAAMRDVSTIGLVVAVFLPAIFLSFLARRYEKQYLALLQPSQG